MIISIDIGTSYSTVCLLNAEGRAEPVETSTGISIYGSKYSLPSAVFVEEDGKVLVGQAAMNSRKKKPQNFRSEFKRDLGQNIPIALGGRSFLPEEFYTEMFRHMEACARTRGEGTVEKAYITYPASFGKAKCDKILQAARNAGLFQVELLDEPTAAAMCYGAKGALKDGDILLVYDFGGGTFDVSLIQYANGAYEALTPAMGIEHCGGIDIDRAIYADMLSKVDGETLQQLSENKTNKMRFEGQLAELAVKIKHHLSSAEYADEAIPVGFDIVDYRLDRERLNSMIADMVFQTVECCKDILNCAGITVKDIHGILLAGGTSRVPLVQEMVQRFADGTPVHMDVDPDFAVAMGALEKGHAYELYNLGLCYEKGEGAEQDYEKAAECYEKSANQGNAAAQYRLGTLYEAGLGVGQDIRKASEWYEKAAGQGNAAAQCSLGMMYEEGRGVEQDFGKAAELYQRSAEQGNAKAQNRLGCLYANGEGVEQDYEKAAEWYGKAAKQGDEDAVLRLSTKLDFNELAGHTKQKVNVSGETAEGYRKAAEQGDAAAQFELGVMYENGQGVEKDYVKAVEWYRKAAEQGNAAAQCNLGAKYANGQGVKRDATKAVEWYRKAAEQGNTSAQFILGIRYETGQGVKQDYAKAVEWYRKAAEQGVAAAQKNLGGMYANGRGVKQDSAKAEEWYRKAADQGNEDAQRRLDKMVRNYEYPPRKSVRK